MCPDCLCYSETRVQVADWNRYMNNCWAQAQLLKHVLDKFFSKLSRFDLLNEIVQLGACRSVASIAKSTSDGSVGSETTSSSSSQYSTGKVVIDGNDVKMTLKLRDGPGVDADTIVSAFGGRVFAVQLLFQPQLQLWDMRFTKPVRAFERVCVCCLIAVVRSLSFNVGVVLFRNHICGRRTNQVHVKNLLSS